MCHPRTVCIFSAACWLLLMGISRGVQAQEAWRLIPPEQRRMEIRAPSRLPVARLPDLPPPPVVSEARPETAEHYVSLDDAIRMALANSEVIRVLTGDSAASTGRTVYDPAIANAQIDRARAPFDPALSVENDFTRTETFNTRFARAFDPRNPPNPLPETLLETGAMQGYGMRMGLSKTTRSGGTAGLDVNAAPSRATTGLHPSNPSITSSVDLSFTQPLLRGAGARVSLAPIMIARIDTERSVYQMQSSVQQMVSSVIAGYWSLVFARTDAWARRKQVEQGEHSLDLAQKRWAKGGMGEPGDVAQARSALASFRAAMITAEANVLQREAALQNVLGLPPSESARIVPVTPPPAQWLEIDWDELFRLAERYRPDLIELKLVIEADRQRLVQARNWARPAVDATAMYRFHGLSGKHPAGAIHSGQFADWRLGVGVSVPLGLRDSRAALRQEQLALMRDQANLQQGLHNAAHELAASYRNLAQYHQQYLAYKEARAAAEKNLDVQFRRYHSGLGTIYLNVLQAISSWGNTVSSESQALAAYNSELANLQALTGTILQTHEIWFTEQRFGSLGPKGRWGDFRCYPRDRSPGPSTDQYQNIAQPAENAFDLADPLPKVKTPVRPFQPPEQIPAPPPQQ